MDAVNIYIETGINPTESEDRVMKAIENVFADLPVHVKPARKGSILLARSEDMDSLTNLRNLLRRERIRSAARKVLFEGLKGNTISFCLNKQVAYAGHISFSMVVGESPLGSISVQIECDDPRELINWLAPRKA